MQKLDVLENIICKADTILRTLYAPRQRPSHRATPAQMHIEPNMSAAEKQLVAGLMRVNHAGEICAQALYQGQAWTAKLTEVREQMIKAAEEEVDHLAWCEQRLHELNSHPSIFNPIWYCGSFMMGALAGLAGDQWSLGFVAETERQVTAHLQRHLQRLPEQDIKTKAILTQMQIDEAHHAQTAQEAGATELPILIRQFMNWTSKLMTQSSYYI